MIKLPETLKISSIFVLFFTLTSYNPQSFSFSFQQNQEKTEETNKNTPLNTTKNVFAQQANLQLIEVAETLGIATQEMSQKPYVESLWQDESSYFPLQLKEGKNYAILGVCDKDCEDIDLKLYDHNGKIIDYDTSSDNTPLVTVKAEEAQELKIKVEMSTCAVAPCYYGIGVFERSM